MNKVVIFIQFIFISVLYFFIIFPAGLIIFNPQNKEQIFIITISVSILAIICGSTTTYITEKKFKNNKQE